MNSLLIRVAACLLTGLAPQIILAQTPPAAANNYKVEVIIFRNSQLPAGSEDYSAVPEGRGFSDKRDNSGAAPTFVRALEESELQLTALATKLQTSGATQVLAHVGWVQTATNWGRHVGLPLEQFGINAPGLTGTLYLERGELLHFGASLQLGSNPGYSLSELRKVRFNERHYLDNPAFGVIVQVSPVR
jgi:Peptidoglycan-binding protein, CsiV